MTEKVIRYANDAITVEWRPERCIHSQRCWRELGQVFRPKEKKWVDVDAAPPDVIRDQVNKCPSGALSIKTDDMEHGTASSGTQVDLMPNGPALVKGAITITYPDGRTETKEKGCALCRCGASANKPFCDGSHKSNGFEG
ncbi:MAG: (4Fe-4S)-binding protein [Flavobacteriales bacterium]|nr:(4Fe-4S)-binding protein [Flavobacteriales bacterium]